MVNGHGDRRRSREHFPVPDRTTAEVLRDLPLMNVERAILGDLDHRVPKNTAPYDHPKPWPQGFHELKTLLVMDFGDTIYWNPGSMCPSFVGFILCEPRVDEFENEKPYLLDQGLTARRELEP